MPDAAACPMHQADDCRRAATRIRHAYHASTWPANRPPGLFLKDGTAPCDQFGSGFTLVNFGRHDTPGFEQVTGGCSIPLKVLKIADDRARRLYERDRVQVIDTVHGAPTAETGRERTFLL